MTVLIHTLAFHWPADPNGDEYNEGFLCVCGDLFVDKGEATRWEPPVLQFSAHLKEMNVDSGLLTRPKTSDELYQEAQESLRGFEGGKPEKPPGDDPRSGYLINPDYSIVDPKYFESDNIFSANYWRRLFGLDPK